MLLTLLESGPTRASKRVLGIGLASFAIHTALIGAVAYATMAVTRNDVRVRVDTNMVLLAADERQKPPEPQPVQLVDAFKGFQTVVMPAQIPLDIPPVDLRERFD